MSDEFVKTTKKRSTSSALYGGLSVKGLRSRLSGLEEAFRCKV
jgi:hypothetical protein